MAKSNSKKRYFQLGDKALSFSDALSGLVIRSKNETVEISAGRVGRSSRVREALTNGHVVEVEAGDAEGEITKLPLKEIVPQAAGTKLIVQEETPEEKKARKEAAKKAEEDEDDEEDEKPPVETKQEKEEKAMLLKTLEANKTINPEVKKSLKDKNLGELRELNQQLSKK